MQALKNAIKLKDLNPMSEIFILYRDMMTYGFKEKYYKEAREKGIMFLQYDKDKKPEITIENGLLVKTYEPMLQETLEIPADYVILSTGMQPSPDNVEVAKILKVPLNVNGFFLEAHVKLRPVEFSTEGVFVAGACHSPKFITECISQASAAASRACVSISHDKMQKDPAVSCVNEELCNGCGLCVEICPFSAIDLEDGKAIVNKALCKGCGLCSGTCRSGAIQHSGYSDHQILEMIKESMNEVI
jgi:heterodisulfide reductase subunit A-like polyferredoxin